MNAQLRERIASRSCTRRTWRRVVEPCLLIACLILAARTWLLMGIVMPLRVASDSMWPALVGPHYAFQCPTCEFTFTCGADELATHSAALCPRCGVPAQPKPEALQPGQRIWVNRAPYAWHAPRRWDMVVARCPAADGSYCVKRVVGLPGETIQILGGNVFVDGALARRSYDRLCAMLIPIHIEPFSTAAQAPGARWWPTGESRWRRTPEGYVFEDSNRPALDPDWLIYHHQHVSRSGAQPSPILDDVPYAQNESRELVPADDILLRVELQAERAEITFRVGSADDPAQVVIQAGQGRGVYWERNRPIAFSFDSRAFQRPLSVSVGLIDGELRCALEAREVFHHACAKRSHRSSAVPFAISVTGGPARLDSLEIFRDVQYESARQTGGTVLLGQQELFLVGDNTSHSMDSRHFGPVSRNSVLGQCLAW